ncbi:MAG TPA: MerR family DNA-binding transcriptional regulator, partial [Ktedonobacteraceae bacterium]|nr:MerR family DNA-binding transcriptional regulator [Ktedonobacteraceae bacterium]
MTAHPLRTIDLARAGAISVQQVRNYEYLGFLPPAERSKHGYRLYTEQHLAALKTVRCMLAGYGWQRTLEIMQALHHNDLAAALALIDARHAEFTSRRHQIERTLIALRLLAESGFSALPNPHQLQRVRIGDAAKQVGVRVSALHFWEQQGLLQPL